ncbi:MAG: hypothetical protein OIN84_16000 [Candidatus Methanoperedens sp.]|nr:hypothetical protein [Candidatus Methanoperedens sp. BLZ2]MCX9079468.1 hypothetical protein [Candidatus Methanoperedens sp.]
MTKKGLIYMNTNEIFKNKKLAYGFTSLIGLAFMSFVAGWVFLIPIATMAFLLYGYTVYSKDQKHRISVNYKPSEAMKAIARREMELNKEKDRLMYEQSQGEIKW